MEILTLFWFAESGFTPANETDQCPISSTFCYGLRKVLTNARLKGVEQVGFDRVLRFIFENSHEHSIFMSKYSEMEISS